MSRKEATGRTTARTTARNTARAAATPASRQREPRRGNAESKAAALSTPLPSHHWAHLTSADFRTVDTSALVAVLPVAATEQHGPHLPLDVDTVIADGLVSATADRLDPSCPVLFLPTQTIGKSDEHAAFAGTLSLDATTLAANWLAIGRGIAAAGVRRLVLFNTHGGNVSTMDIVGRTLRVEQDMAVFSVNWFDLGLPARVADADELRFGVHGGLVETALMLALAPDRVRMALAENFHSARRDHARQFAILGDGRSSRFSWATQDLNPKGAAGNAGAATAKAGRAIIDHVASRFAALLAEVARFPLDALVDGPSG